MYNINIKLKKGDVLMTVKIQKNKRYVVPQVRAKEVARMLQELIAEQEKINNMTEEEYDNYIMEEVKKAEEEIEKGAELYTHEEVMKEIEEDLEADRRERKNYEKWMKLTKRERTHAV